MTSPIVRAASRRRFLQYLAGSPLFASAALSAYGAETPSKLPDPMIWAPAGGAPIGSPKDAVNLFDFEPGAPHNVPPAHFGHMPSPLSHQATPPAHPAAFLQFP